MKTPHISRFFSKINAGDIGGELLGYATVGAFLSVLFFLEVFWGSWKWVGGMGSDAAMVLWVPVNASSLLICLAVSIGCLGMRKDIESGRMRSQPWKTVFMLAFVIALVPCVVDSLLTNPDYLGYRRSGWLTLILPPFSLFPLLLHIELLQGNVAFLQEEISKRNICKTLIIAIGALILVEIAGRILSFVL